MSCSFQKSSLSSPYTLSFYCSLVLPLLVENDLTAFQWKFTHTVFANNLNQLSHRCHHKATNSKGILKSYLHK